MSDPRRALPSVGSLIESPLVRAASAAVPQRVVTAAARRVIDRAREHPANAPRDESAWAAAVTNEIHALQLPSLRPVFNATGVVLHTNLGRAPLAQAAIDAIVATAGGATNLEFDLAAGKRGSRYDHCVALLRELTGAPDALVVNNCAAALVLALNTFARDREAIVSRGELIEIGGAFRVPEIMARSGARLREVGTTNRTSVSDYQSALGTETGAIVKVHRSNFEMLGFVAEVSVRELKPVATAAGVPLLHDFGSGLLLDLAPFGLTGEPTARDAVRDGATLVAMSGDKLLGGPQAGILLGDKDAIAALKTNPLTRALRVDKMTIAALTATLQLYRDPDAAVREIPTLQMLAATAGDLETRARALAQRLESAGIPARAIATEGSVGGGAFPSARLASWAVALGGPAVDWEARLRDGRIPVIGHVADDALLLELRSIPPVGMPRWSRPYVRRCRMPDQRVVRLRPPARVAPSSMPNASTPPHA
ncbi:MAG: L-seryl-tRNA(Sec) selenium transferase [Gemmatimonadaceae bacterium]